MVENQSQDAASTPAPEAPARSCPAHPIARWIARFGVFGFLFFFVKGMLWLTVPALIAWLGLR